MNEEHEHITIKIVYSYCVSFYCLLPNTLPSLWVLEIPFAFKDAPTLDAGREKKKEKEKAIKCSH